MKSPDSHFELIGRSLRFALGIEARRDLRSLARMFCLLVALVFASGSAVGQSPPTVSSATPNARNVILITMDGMRWQEVFGGVEGGLLDKELGGVKDVPELKRRFQRDTPIESRQALMPFFWKTLAAQGVIFGNPEQESKAVVSNGLNFSYPGYSEILCGFGDPKIDSNAKKNNENTTVLEWLTKQPGFENSVAAFCSWDVFPFIINETRSGIPVNAGWEPLSGDLKLSTPGTPTADAFATLDQLSFEIPRYFPEVRFDYFTFRAAEEYLQSKKPRVLYVSLGETDDWAHAGRYDLYLDAAYRNDEYIQRLWALIQSMPEYKDNTTLILTTDHGRGDNRVDWKSHGKEIANCEHIWMAVIGPDVTAPKINGTTVTQSQVAATVAASVGLDYSATDPKVAKPLPVFGQ